MTQLNEELIALTTMLPAQLRSEWRRVFRVAPPDLTPDLLRRGIAYRLQERRHGGLTTALARDLDRLAAKLARGESLPSVTDRQLKPGTRLVRHWKGVSYLVLVTDEGYAMDDRRFTSLSQIAQAITGAHWSGPRFFGIRAKAAVAGAAATSGALARRTAVRARAAQNSAFERADA